MRPCAKFMSHIYKLCGTAYRVTRSIVLAVHVAKMIHKMTVFCDRICYNFQRGLTTLLLLQIAAFISLGVESLQ